MEELEPGEPGNLFGDGQLADRRRSIQQNQFHDALSSSMRLPPHAGSELRPAAGAQRTLAGIGSTPPLTLVLSEHIGKSCPSPAVPTRPYAHSASAAQSESPSAALPAASGRVRLDADHTRHAMRRRDTEYACRVPVACRCCATLPPSSTPGERSLLVA